jgi:hypothetical protein
VSAFNNIFTLQQTKLSYHNSVDDRQFAGSSLFVALTLVNVDVAEPDSDR